MRIFSSCLRVYILHSQPSQFVFWPNIPSMKTLYLLLMLLPLSTFAQIVSTDPYKVTLSSKITHILPIRIIDHEVLDEKFVKEQIRAAEVVYAQCGIRIKLAITKKEIIPHTERQDELTVFENNQTLFTKGALELFAAVFPDKSQNVLDVHIVDHLRNEIRINQSTNDGMIEFGRSFNPILFGSIYFNASAELAAQHVFIAAETVKLDTQTSMRYRGKGRSFPRHLSLLAHEIGHYLFEGQKLPFNVYRDHWCDGINNYCPVENLMSVGGFPDSRWKHETKDQFLGFDPLPKLDSRQCELMLLHPLIIKLD